MRNVSIFLFVALMLAAVTFKGAESKKVSVADAKAAIKNVKKYCGPKTGVSDAIVEGASRGEFPPDRALQCYQMCVLDMMKAIKDDKLRVEVMMKQADLMLFEEDAERVKKAIAACGPQATSTDPCEASWQFSKCFYNQDKEVYLLP